jgi:voltage-gated potassium channel Kch
MKKNSEGKRLQPIVATAAGSLIALVALGTFTFHFLEGWSFVASFYFSVTTLTTVGYGDLVPTSDFSRLVTAIYVFIGVSISVTALGVIGTRYLERREERLRDRRKKGD